MNTGIEKFVLNVLYVPEFEKTLSCPLCVTHLRWHARHTLEATHAQITLQYISARATQKIAWLHAKSTTRPRSHSFFARPTVCRGWWVVRSTRTLRISIDLDAAIQNIAFSALKSVFSLRPKTKILPSENLLYCPKNPSRHSTVFNCKIDDSITLLSRRSCLNVRIRSKHTHWIRPNLHIEFIKCNDLNNLSEL